MALLTKRRLVSGKVCPGTKIQESSGEGEREEEGMLSLDLSKAESSPETQALAATKIPGEGGGMEDNGGGGED